MSDHLITAARAAVAKLRAVDWRKALTFARERLREPSTRVGITVAIGLLAREVAPAEIDGWIEVASTLLSVALIVIPDKAPAAVDYAGEDMPE